MNKPISQRKNPRLKEYDYGSPGFYFVTINTHNREKILSQIASQNAVRAAAYGGPPPFNANDRTIAPPIVMLTRYGEIVRKYIERIDISYNNARVDQYAIMPNHIHLVIQITEPRNGPPWAAARTANLIRMINSLKTLTSKEAGFTLWHRGYFDHIIRTDEDLYNTRRYVKYNASKHLLNQEEGHDTHA